MAAAAHPNPDTDDRVHWPRKMQAWRVRIPVPADSATLRRTRTAVTELTPVSASVSVCFCLRLIGGHSRSANLKLWPWPPAAGDASATRSVAAASWLSFAAGPGAQPEAQSPTLRLQSGRAERLAFKFH